jgi:hypothetical protein
MSRRRASVGSNGAAQGEGAQVRIDRIAKALLVIVTIVNAVFLIGTAMFTQYFWSVPDWDKAPNQKLLYMQANLATENVLASWWSSMFLFGISIVALLCSAVIADGRPTARLETTGWRVLAAIFLFLSWDEMGSIHERFSLIQDQFHIFDAGFLIWLIPFILLVPAVMAPFAWIYLRQNRLALFLFVAGLLLYCSVPLQEKMEMLAYEAAGAAWHRPVLFLLLEEGAELLGATCFLMSFLVYFRARQAANGADLIRIVARLCEPRNMAVAASAAAIAMYLVNSFLPTLRGFGVAGNWFPSVVAFASALLVALLLAKRAAETRWEAAALHGVLLFGLICSSFIGAALNWVVVEMRLQTILYTVAAAGIATAALMLLTSKPKLHRYIAASWGVLMALAFCLPDDAPTLVLAAFALFLPVLSERLSPYAGWTSQAKADRQRWLIPAETR